MPLPYSVCDRPYMCSLSRNKCVFFFWTKHTRVPRPWSCKTDWITAPITVGSQWFLRRQNVILFHCIFESITNWSLHHSSPVVAVKIHVTTTSAAAILVTHQQTADVSDFNLQVNASHWYFDKINPARWNSNTQGKQKPSVSRRQTMSSYSANAK